MSRMHNAPEATDSRSTGLDNDPSSGFPRVDLAAKVFGGAAFVHDMAMDGMLHARIVRPPSYNAQLTECAHREEPMRKPAKRGKSRSSSSASKGTRRKSGAARGKAKTARGKATSARSKAATTRAKTKARKPAGSRASSRPKVPSLSTAGTKLKQVAKRAAAAAVVAAGSAAIGTALSELSPNRSKSTQAGHGGQSGHAGQGGHGGPSGQASPAEGQESK